MSQSAVNNSSQSLKLLSTKQHGPSLQLTISIVDKPPNKGTSILSDQYNIHNLIHVCFQATESAHTYGARNDQRELIYRIQIKKHMSAKDTTVHLKISCHEKHLRSDIVCEEDWGYWICIGSFFCIANKSFAVNFEVTLSKTQSIINRKLYNDEKFTDFTLIGDGGSVAVHKAHLAVHSDAFMTMFERQWKETKESRIKFKGVTQQTLHHFKTYMYLGSLPEKDEELRALLLFAMKYLVESLKTECSVRLLLTITAENFNSLVEFCIENELHELLSIISETTLESVLAKCYALRIRKGMTSKIEDKKE